MKSGKCDLPFLKYLISYLVAYRIKTADRGKAVRESDSLPPTHQSNV